MIRGRDNANGGKGERHGPELAQALLEFGGLLAGTGDENALSC